MSDAHNIPTPASGIPAAVAAGETPHLNEATIILRAVEALRGDFETHRGDLTTKFERLEAKTDAHAGALGNLTNEVAAHRSQLAELATAQVSTAKAASAAAEISAQALAKANSSQDENAKMVQSAMHIQKDAIAAAVTAAVAPVVENVAKLEKNDADRAATLEGQNVSLAALKKSDEETAVTLGAHGKKIDGVVTSLGTIASGVAKLARWQDHWAVKVGIGVAAAAGTFYATMKATTPPPPPPQQPTMIVLQAPPQTSASAPTVAPSH